MKTCTTCKHGKRDLIIGWRFGKCRHPENLKTDLVTGKNIPILTFCEFQRDFGLCGPSGKWHEAKPVSLWQRFLSKV